MKWFILFVGIVVLCGVVALLLGRLGGGLGAATSTLSHEPLPDDTITDDDLDELRFDVALRGYRMGQVDGVLARLRRELHAKDEELAVLRADQDTTVLPAAAEEAEPTSPESSEECAAGEASDGQQRADGPSTSAEHRAEGP